jgi:hypothetical protein
MWRGAWDSTASYVINDLVEHNGSSYVSIQSHNASLATEPGVGVNWTSYWNLVAQAGTDGVIGPQGPQGLPGANGIFDLCDKEILEMEMEFKTAHLCYYKTFAYNPGKQLIDIDIYSDSTANLLLFHKDLFYNAQKQLERTVLTRISDGATLTTNFTYDVQKNLQSAERSGYCTCIFPWNYLYSIDINTGSVVSGSITDTYSDDGRQVVFSEVAASPAFDYDLNFVNVPDATAEYKITLAGHYVGDSTHNIKIRIWNNDTMGWDDVTAAADDFPSNPVEQTYQFNLPVGSKYLNNGAMKFKLIHTSSGFALHRFYIDYLYLDYQ